MKLTKTMKTGILTEKVHTALYTALMDIRYANRGEAVNSHFEPNKEYIYKGENGEVKVTFEHEDIYTK